jgi:glycerophosphoryl diester phosphodiesterase
MREGDSTARRFSRRAVLLGLASLGLAAPGLAFASSTREAQAPRRWEAARRPLRGRLAGAGWYHDVRDTQRTRQMPRPLVISHRTHMGSMPENTLAGIEAALASGADGVEVDVRGTAEGALVLVHDATLERTAGLPHAVASLTLEQMRGVRVTDPFGGLGPQPVPTLEEALALVAGRAIVVIDVCASGLVEAITQAVRAADAESWCRVTTPAAEEAGAYALALPGAKTLLTVPYQRATPEGLAEAIDTANLLGLAGVNPNYRSMGPLLLLEASLVGVEVATWTVNEPPDIARICTAGVSSITSDYPERVLARLGPAAAGSA